MKEIILVEDDLYIQQALSLALSSEYHLTTAKNMKEAIICLEKQCDLWLIDISLPDGNGIDFCKKIRQKATTPILFLTANQLEDSIVAALEAGGDDYVSKPFSMRVLRARIRALLRRQKKVSEKLTSKDIEIYLDSRQVFKNGQEIILTKTAYEILTTLMEYEGIVLTRNQLIELLESHNDHFINDNTISVHVKRLREKIGNYQNEEYIETIRGVGYRWKNI